MVVTFERKNVKAGHAKIAKNQGKTVEKLIRGKTGDFGPRRMYERKEEDE